MMRFVITILAAVLAHGSALAHELTPTYPKLEPSYMGGISVMSLEMFNRREDVRFFAIDVYDKDWRPVMFATRDQIIQVDYLEKHRFDVFIRDDDVDVAHYVCTTSKLLTENVQSTGVSSRICSRIE